ncbi:MAG: capsule assembly Wzi family protein [Candidatus Acidiferrales bacterium]
MTKWRMSLVFSCCLLAAIEGMTANCCAQSASPQPDEKASADKKATNDKPSKPEPLSKKEFSSSFSDPLANSMEYDNSLGPHLFTNIAEDQRVIWTSPSHLGLTDADWLLPLGVVAGGMLATDTEVSKHLSNSPSRLKYSTDFSNYGIASLAATAGGLYIWGRITHDDHKRETGFLAGEAAIDSLAATYALKYAFGRERPLQSNFQGNFWQGGDSFPSEHSSAAWSIAGVIAHEYPGPLTSIFAYGLASAVSASRVDAKQHFPTDVLVGSAIGWFVAQEVYRRHHDPELGGEWQTYRESRDEGPGRVLGGTGSPYVELDSWIYPAIERLAALGYIHSGYLGMRPWTRIECAQLVQQAGDAIRADASVPEQANQIYSTLATEFRGELDESGLEGERFVRLESVYAGATDISGPPLHDSDHFGQTIINNYGRPYEEGFNSYDGFSAYGTAGRFTIYVRGEYQHAPFAPAYSLAARQAIATADANPLQPATPFSAVNQFTLLDTYVAASAAGWDFSFGKQSLWWGPGDGGALIFSSNAEPIYMFRGSRVAPVGVPLVSRLLGPMKVDFFVGKLSGNEFPARPLMHGEKLSFKPTANLEFGFSRTVEFGGVGRPMTAGAIWNSYASVKSSTNYGASRNPGKRSSGVDVSYKVPFVRNWLTVYVDSFAADDVTPLANPPRAAWNSGFYMPRLPRLPKLDLRVEAGYTDTTTDKNTLGQFVYFDYFYHDLYTNKGNILGSWIGREGKGVQAWSTYWFSPRNNLQFGYRNAKVDKDFIPGGETVNDGSLKINWLLHRDVALSASVQYEKWAAPILAPGPQTNWTSSVEITLWPHLWEH